MKKLVLIPIILFCSISNALELKIYKCGITSLTKPSDQTYIDLDIFDRNRTGYEVVKVFMYHRNEDFSFSDTIVLESVFITDMVKNDFPQVDGYKRIYFNMPDDFPYGAYFIGVSYCKSSIGYFWKYLLTATGDETIESKKGNATYFDFNGKIITNPIGFCIEEIDGKRSKVFIKGE